MSWLNRLSSVPRSAGRRCSNRMPRGTTPRCKIVHRRGRNDCVLLYPAAGSNRWRAATPPCARSTSYLAKVAIDSNNNQQRYNCRRVDIACANNLHAMFHVGNVENLRLSRDRWIDGCHPSHRTGSKTLMAFGRAAVTRLNRLI